MHGFNGYSFLGSSIKTNLVHIICWFSNNHLLIRLQANILMWYSIHHSHSLKLLYFLCKQFMGLVGWIHWLYSKVQRLDQNNDPLMQLWMVILKVKFLYHHNYPLVGMHISTLRVSCWYFYLDQ